MFHNMSTCVSSDHDADDPGHGGRVQLGRHQPGEVAPADILLGGELEGKERERIPWDRVKSHTIR